MPVDLYLAPPEVDPAHLVLRERAVLFNGEQFERTATADPGSVLTDPVRVLDALRSTTAAPEAAGTALRTTSASRRTSDTVIAAGDPQRALSIARFTIATQEIDAQPDRQHQAARVAGEEIDTEAILSVSVGSRREVQSTVMVESSPSRTQGAAREAQVSTVVDSAALRSLTASRSAFAEPAAASHAQRRHAAQRGVEDAVETVLSTASRQSTHPRAAIAVLDVTALVERSQSLTRQAEQEAVAQAEAERVQQVTRQAAQQNASDAAAHRFVVFPRTASQDPVAVALIAERTQQVTRFPVMFVALTSLAGRTTAHTRQGLDEVAMQAEAIRSATFPQATMQTIALIGAFSARVHAAQRSASQETSATAAARRTQQTTRYALQNAVVYADPERVTAYARQTLDAALAPQGILLPSTAYRRTTADGILLPQDAAQRRHDAFRDAQGVLEVPQVLAARPGVSYLRRAFDAVEVEAATFIVIFYQPRSSLLVVFVEPGARVEIG